MRALSGKEGAFCVPSIPGGYAWRREVENQGALDGSLRGEFRDANRPRAVSSLRNRPQTTVCRAERARQHHPFAYRKHRCFSTSPLACPPGKGITFYLKKAQLTCYNEYANISAEFDTSEYYNNSEVSYPADNLAPGKKMYVDLIYPFKKGSRKTEIMMNFDYSDDNEPVITLTRKSL